MDEIELEIAIAEEEARAKQKTSSNPYLSGPVNFGPVDLNVGLGDRSDLPPDQKNIDFLAGQNEGIAREDTNALMAEGYNQAAGTANKFILGGIGAAAGAPLGAGPVSTALASAIGFEGGETVADVANKSATTGSLQPPTKSLEDNVESIALNTAVGAAAPYVLSGAGKALGWVNSLFNSAPKVARRIGAANIDLNPNAEKFIVPKVQELLDNSEFFNKNIVNSSDPGAQFNRAKGYKNIVGQQIGDFYASNPALPVLRDDIMATPQIKKLLTIAENPNITDPTKGEAIRALELLKTVVPENRAVMNLADVWTMRKDIDTQLISSLYQKGTGTVTNYSEYLSDVADALRGTMDTTITSAAREGVIAPGIAERLLKNKQEFSNISAVTDVLGRKVGQTSGLDFLDKVSSTPFQAVVKPPIASIRAGAGKLGNVGNALENLSQYTNPYAVMGTSLFQRSTKPEDVNFEELKGAVASKASAVMRPDEVEVLLQNIDQTFTSGNVLAKRQMMGVLTQQFPDLFEPTPDGLLSVVDGKIGDPMEKDIHTMGAMDKPASERAKVMAGLWDGGKYQPLDTGTVQPKAPTTNEVNLANINSSLDSTFSGPSNFDSSADKGTTSMLDELNRAIAVHDRDVQTVH